MDNSVTRNAAALNEGNIVGTAKELSANPDKFYLISTGCSETLCSVIDRLSKSTRDIVKSIRQAVDNMEV